MKNSEGFLSTRPHISLYAKIKLHGYKIIAITESWATPDITDNELGLDGFVLFRKDRSEIRVGRGGGVLLYVSNELGVLLPRHLMHLNVNRCGLKYMMTREQMSLWVYVISVH